MKTDVLLKNKANIGAWNQFVALDPKKFLTVNLSPIQITEDQLIQLYLMLYPMIVADFTSRADNLAWARDIHLAMTQNDIEHSTALNSHVHIGNMGVNTSPPLTDLSIEPWKEQPEDPQYKEAESFVTNASLYSTSIEHRNPALDNPNISRVNVVDINTQYSSKLIYVPFDTNDQATGDNNYTGNS